MMLLVILLAVTINFVIPRLMPGDPIEQQLSQMVVVQRRPGRRHPGDGRRPTAPASASTSRSGTNISPTGRPCCGSTSASRSPTIPRPSTTRSSAGLPWTLGLLGFATMVSFAASAPFSAACWPGRGAAACVAAVGAAAAADLGRALFPRRARAAVRLRDRAEAAAGRRRLSVQPRPRLQLGDRARHRLRTRVLPAASIILAEIGAWAIGMRGMLVSVLGEDYITLAEAKGLPRAPHLPLLRHAQRAAAAAHQPGADPRPPGLGRHPGRGDLRLSRASAIGSTWRSRPRTISSSRASCCCCRSRSRWPCSCSTCSIR